MTELLKQFTEYRHTIEAGLLGVQLAIEEERWDDASRIMDETSIAQSRASEAFKRTIEGIKR